MARQPDMIPVRAIFAVALLLAIAACDTGPREAATHAGDETGNSARKDELYQTTAPPAPSANRSPRADDCAMLDPELLHCPVPRAPQITELSGGSVVVRLAVRRDGTVAQATIVSSTGHRAWRAAVEEAVRDWRFAPSDHGFTRDVPIVFQVDP